MTKKPTSSERRIDTLYVVTGISRLTGEREVCSTPHPKDEAIAMCRQWKKLRALKRVFLRLKVEPFTPPCFPEG